MQYKRIGFKLTAAALYIVGMSVSGAVMAQTIDTTPLWNGVTYEYPWGVSNTSTYGQTFTALNTGLSDFTFYIQGNVGDPSIKYQAYVYAWDGTKATGSALFTSPVSTYTADGSFEAITTTTTGTALTTGQKYVAFLTTAGLQTGQPASTTHWGVSNNYNNAYSGGDFVFYNTGNNFSPLTSTHWDYVGNNGTAFDLAFKMNFSADAVTPEGDSLLLVSSGLLPLAGLGLWHRRRQRRKA